MYCQLLLLVSSNYCTCGGQMAFFGLTQLGAQSTFNVNLISLQNYSCFAEEDFRAAFEKQSGGAASVSLDKVGPMLEEVFGGFAPEQEMEALLGTLQHFGGEISFDHIMTSVAAVAGAPQTFDPHTHQLLSCPRACLSCQPADRRSGRVALRHQAARPRRLKATRPSRTGS